MALRLASNKPLRIDLGDGAWVDVRKDISKGVFRDVLASMPTRDLEKDPLTLDEGLEFQRNLFGALVIGWSLKDNPTVEAYDRILREDAEPLDEALAKHFESVASLTKEEQGKA